MFGVQAFKSFDVDESGKISMEELKEAMERDGSTMTAKDLEVDLMLCCCGVESLVGRT